VRSSLVVRCPECGKEAAVVNLVANGPALSLLNGVALLCLPTFVLCCVCVIAMWFEWNAVMVFAMPLALLSGPLVPIFCGELLSSRCAPQHTRSKWAFRAIAIALLINALCGLAFLMFAGFVWSLRLPPGSD